MKKGKISFIVIFLSIIISIKLIIAQDPIIDWIYQNLAPTFESIFRPILGADVPNEFLFVKVLFFFVIFALANLSLRNIDIFESNRGALFLVSVTFSIIVVRYLPDIEFIRALLLPYTAFGATVGLLGPLLILFFGLHFAPVGPFIRRTIWAIYGFFYVFIWGQRWFVDSGTSDAISASVHWVYVIGLIFVLINIFFEGFIRSQLEIDRLRRARANMLEERAVQLAARMKDAEEAGLHKEAERIRRRYERLLRRI